MHEDYHQCGRRVSNKRYNICRDAMIVNNNYGKSENVEEGNKGYNEETLGAVPSGNLFQARVRVRVRRIRHQWWELKSGSLICGIWRMPIKSADNPKTEMSATDPRQNQQ